MKNNNLKQLKFENMNNVTVLTCANDFTICVYDGKVINILCCPKCGCSNPDLVRVRYWRNGSPDYSINLLVKLKN